MAKKEKKNKERRCLIGGQALLEGVMMRSSTTVALAVRNPEGDIVVDAKRIKQKGKVVKRIPILRGIIAFFASLVSSVKTLLKAADVLTKDEDSEQEEEQKSNKGAVGIAVFIGLILGIGLFIALPFALSFLIEDHVTTLIRVLIEGGFRLAIFVFYLAIVSVIKDMRRMFAYHGAEHRVISCFEKRQDLTIENVQKQSTSHNRCGTTFLFFVMLVSILVFSLATWVLELVGFNQTLITNRWAFRFAMLGVRLALLPLVAGLSYELLRFLAWLPNNKFVRVITFPFRAPGLALQKLSTKKPDDDMVEVALAAFNEVLAMDEDKALKPLEFGQHRYKSLRKKIEERFNYFSVEMAEVDWIFCKVTGYKRSELDRLKIITELQYKKIKAILERRFLRIYSDEELVDIEQYKPIEEELLENKRQYKLDKKFKPRKLTKLEKKDFREKEEKAILRKRTSQILNATGENEFNKFKLGEPLDYILGYREFFGIKIKVDKRVLIPRFETEILVEKAIEIIGDREMSVLDLATGSGAIAKVLSEKTSAKITASDVSLNALEVAKENLKDTQTRVLQSDLFSELKGEKFDLIVSNPPYISSGEIEGLSSDVSENEPNIALNGGNDGLDFYRAIAKDAKAHLNKGGTLLMEVGHTQAADVKKLLEKGYKNIEIIKDLDGVDRVVFGVRSVELNRK